MRRGGSPGRTTSPRVLVAVALMAFALTACRVPPPLSYPLALTPAVDASDEVRQLLANPPTPAQSPDEVARRLAAALTVQSPTCEVLTVGEVKWVAPTPPAAAAVEVRGLCDDSVAGVWYEIDIVSDGQSGWVVSSATKQDICARGVSGTVCV